MHHPPKEWLFFENTHEAIIDRETWELAQKLRKTPRCIDHFGYANPLTGLLYCGAKMYNCRAHANPDTGGRAYDRYDCSNHKLSSIHRDKRCTTHNISTKTVNTLLLDVIRTTCRYALENETEFAELVRLAAALRHEDAAKALRKQQSRDKKRHDELDVIIKKLYESYATGKRTKLLRFLVNDREFDVIEQKQKLMGAANLSVYLRRMAMEGYVLKLDLPELKGILSQMHRMSSNINQITKRFNATGRLYPDELVAVQKDEEEIWKALRELIARLSELP